MASEFCGGDCPPESPDARRRSGADLRSIFRASPMAVGLLVDHVFQEVSDSLCEMLGYAREELIGQGTQFLAPASDECDVSHAETHGLTCACAKGAVETRWQRKDGVVLDLLIHSATVDSIDFSQGVVFAAIDVTERRRDEAALRTSERRFRDISEATGELIWEVDSQGLYTYVNRACRKMLGYTEEEIVGRLHFYDLYPERGRDEFRKRAAEIFHNRETIVDLYNPMVAKDGRVLDVLTNGVPVLDDDGRLVGYCGSDRDITERRRAQKALAEEAARRRIFFEQSRDGLVVLNRNGQVHEANSRFAEMLGYSMEDLVRLYVWDWDAVWTREQLEERVQAVGQAGEHFETRHRRKDGTCFDVEIITSATIWGGEKYVFCVCRDISRRKAAEATLRQSEERLRLALAAARMGVWEWDMRTGAVQLLPEYFDVPGVERFGQTAQAGKDLLHPDDAVRFLEALANAIAERTDFAVEHRIRTPAGEIRWLSTHGRAEYDEAGEPRRMVGTVYDITERKQAEEERRQLETQLFRAQRIESLGVLAGGIAHDFNNLLAGMRMFADVLLRDMDPSSKAARNVGEIKKAAKRGADLTRQILTYAGKSLSHPEPLSLSEIVEDMRDMLRVVVSKRATFEYRLAPGLATTHGDAGQIRQVVMNLVLNASEALGEGGGVISISTSMVAADDAPRSPDSFGERGPAGPLVCLEVADTGCGMDKATLDKVYDPFFTTKPDGHGLGLATVHGIVRSHHGTIQAASEPGRGSIFRVLLPAAGDLPPVPPAPAAPKATCRCTGTVLVVDDEEMVRNGTKMLLEAEDFSVLTAANGQQALELFHRHREKIVCVILDLTMSKMSGDELFHALRRSDPDLRIVLTSGYAEATVMRRFEGQRVFAFVEKPDPIDAVIVKLQESLAQA